METRDDIQTAQTQAWWTVRDESTKTDDYRRFATILWHAFVGSKKLDVASLKPKFMLRQFVDEIPTCKQQGMLIALAYGPITTWPSDSEMLEGLTQSYSFLHLELTKRSGELHVLTDGEISYLTVSAIFPPFALYEHWLFNC